MIELYSGTALISHALLDVGLCVGPPIEKKDGWDLSDPALFELLLRLSAAGRVGLFWLGPPCTTYSLARAPRLRSVEEPWGFDVLEPETASGNLHMHQSLALFLTQSLAGNEAILETPWGAYSRKLPWWVWLAQRSTEIRIDQCRYSTPYLKPTSLLCTSRLFAPLACRCKCVKPHERLEGSRTSKAAEYPKALCLEVAKVSAAVAKVRMAAGHSSTLGREESPNTSSEGLRDHRGAQRFVSHIWATQLSEALPCRTIRSYRSKRPNHINVLECHAHTTLMQIAPRDSRLLVLQDSMVTLGANAKGMSWTSLQVRPVPGIAGSCLQVRLCLLLTVTLSPLVVGPRPSNGARDRRDLDNGRVTLVTANLRLRLLEDLQQWLQCEEPEAPLLPELAQHEPIRTSLLLEEYGRCMYEDGAPRRDYAEAISAVVQKFAFLRTFVTGPWRLLTTWECIAPGKVHPPLPLPLLKALATTALTWGWTRFALLLLVGFYALLRPCELIALKVSDLLMASQTGLDNVMFIRLQLVKSRTRGARVQSVRLDVPYVVNFSKKCFKTMQPNEGLWLHSMNLFRTRLQHVLRVVTGSPDLCVPSSLRPGGATFWFREWDENLLKLQWRGRWLHFKTLAHYVQELGCINIMEAILAPYLRKVQSLAALCESACKLVVVVADL